MKEHCSKAQPAWKGRIPATAALVVLILGAPALASASASAQTSVSTPPYVGTPPSEGTPPYVGTPVSVNTPPYAGVPPYAGGAHQVAKTRPGPGTNAPLEPLVVSSSTGPVTTWDVVGLIAMATVMLGGLVTLRRQLR